MKAKPWNMGVGIAAGVIVGALIWWNAYVPDAGVFQNPQLIIVPAGMGVLVVSIRNKRKKVGPYDPEVIERNRSGRV
ncbi:MAG: hypothetical protein EON58_05800 [Alphaproteobacteria bacterium]|nr:MAG: hypothetical protein EON58_05800 [Alphaproteobacteria bacterium]